MAMALSAGAPPSHLSPTSLLSFPFSKPLSLPRRRCQPIATPRKKKPVKVSAFSSSNLAPIIPSAADPSPHIRRLCLRGDLERALLHLDSAAHQDLDEEAYVSLLRLCLRMRAAKEAHRVYAHLDSHGRRLSVRLRKVLMDVLAKLGDMANARKVFDEMPSRDQRLWRLMILGYLECEKLVEVLELFRMMRDLSVVPDLMTMAGVIRACWVVGEESLGKELHGYAIRTGLGGEVPMCTSLIKMYFSFGEVVEAEKVFSRLTSKDLPSWNALVSGYEKNGLHEDAIRVYQEVESQGLVPDKVLITSILSACASTRNLELGTKLHELARRYGLLQGAEVSTALINMYSKCNCMDKALEVFERMPKKDAVAWTSMMTGLRVHGRNSEVLDLFHQMLSQGLVPDQVAITTVLSTCASTGNLELGTKLHDFAMRYGLFQSVVVRTAIFNMYLKCYRMDKALEVFEGMPKKDVVAWTSMMTGLGANGRHLEALNLFRQMPVDLKPDPFALVGALLACSVVRALTCGKEIHAHVLRRGLAFHDSLQNALLVLYAKCGRMEFARRQFILCENKEVRSLNTMLNGYAAHGLGSGCSAMEALMCAKEIHALALRSGLALHGFSMNLLLELYSKCGRMVLARRQFILHENKDVRSLTTMLNGYAKHGSTMEALMYGKEIHAHALRSGLEFHNFLQNALLDLFAKCGRMELARRQFIFLENKDATSLNIMLNGYAKHGSAMEALMYGKEIHAHALRTGLAFHAFFPNSLPDLYAKYGGMELAHRQFALLEDKDGTSWTTTLLNRS